ncbi:MAG: hypothetical protein ILP13_00355 [Lachnospiraceae bacterium]|nr:hypothetical protein [Lachnospiraceae bacterium]
MKGKRTIFLAGDSTVQSYSASKYPQAGWGQEFWKFFEGAGECHESVRPDAPGSHCVCYELPKLNIENHAFAARSSRSFIEQGRLEEIMKVAEPGDYLFVQFAHNDAYKAREERYVAPEDFHIWLQKYKDACDERGMTCVYVTPVTMRVFDKEGNCQIAFREYADEMVKFASSVKAPLVDLSALSTALMTEVGPKAARDYYLWIAPGEYPDTDLKDGANDNAHFQENGAVRIAELVAEGLKELSGFDSLGFLQELLRSDYKIPEFARHLPKDFAGWGEEEDMLLDAGKEIIKRE